LLEISNLEVVYHDVIRALRGVSLRVPEGKIVALLGPNGAGKTTALRAVCGLLPLHDAVATKGAVTYGGTDLLASRPQRVVAAGVAQVMEGRRVFADLTVEENLRAGALTRRDGAWHEELEGMMRRFPLLGERRHQIAGYLSGGEQQMLAIARALLVSPSLLIFDEPSLGLAPRVVGEVAEVIREVRAQGKSILLIEQNAALALELADYGYVLENGKIVLDGDPSDLAEDPDFQEFYLGIGAEGRRSYADVKLYRRRKRWLS
jgi:branched-chain amino acid transport system ATP-binding protein